MISGHGSIDLAVKAVKLGAEDFLQKPFGSEKLLLLIHQILNIKLKNVQLNVPEWFYIGKSLIWQNMLSKLDKTYKNKILVSGNIGSGKQEAIYHMINKLHHINKVHIVINYKNYIISLIYE